MKCGIDKHSLNNVWARRKFYRLWLWCCPLVLGCLILGNQLQAQELERIWERGTDYKLAPAPVIADLDMDGRMEAIMIDASSRVRVINLSDGSTIWEKKLGDNLPLLSPVFGHFTGHERINIIVPTATGTLFVFDGASGNPVGPGQVATGYSLRFSPTVFPWGDDQSTSPYREGLIFYSDDQMLHMVWVGPDLTIDEFHTYDIRDALDAPPVVGTTGLAATAPHVAMVTRRGQVHVLSVMEKGRRAFAQLPSNEQHFKLGISLGDLNADGKQDLVAADRAGYLYAGQVVGRELQPVWNEPQEIGGGSVIRRTIEREPTFQPVVIDVNNDGHDDILLLKKSDFELRNGIDGRSLWGDPKREFPETYGHPRVVSSPPALFRSGDQKAYAIFGDQTSISVLDLQGRTSVGKYQIGQQTTVSPLVGDLLGDGQIEAFTLNRNDGQINLIAMGMPAKADTPVWCAPYGGMWRSSSEDRAEAAYRKAQHQHLNKQIDALLERARQHEAASEWTEALRSAEHALEVNPSHDEALRLKRYYFFRGHLISIIIAVILSFALACYLIWQALRYTRRTIEQMLAKRAIGAERFDKAARYLVGLCRRFPNNAYYHKLYGGVLIRLKQFDEEASLIFEKAHQFFPEEHKFLKGLATAYSSIPRYDMPAAHAYHQMAQLVEQKGPWFFILGCALKDSNEPQQALEAFRQAIIHKHEDAKLPGLMTDLYIQLGITQADVLPTLEQVYESRSSDPAFLRVYCLACQNARRYDDQTRATAKKLLELDEKAPEAHIILSTVYLQSGHTKDAMKHANEVLEVNPNDATGLRLLGACYAAERRLDETAMTIFGRALECNPDAPEILLAVSHGFIQDDRLDTEAREIYQRSLVHHPEEESVLLQLSRIAGQDNDDDLTIRTLEPLLKMGKHTRELVLQLADAYCRQGIADDRSEPVYREALIYQPDHATIQDNLAAIYLRNDRTDPEVIGLFEEVYARRPERIDIGVQLVRAYLEDELADKAMELAQQLLGKEADHKELQKLLGAAAEKTNKMEAAVTQYENLLENDANDIETLCKLSKLYGRKRRSDNKAIEVYNRSIEAQPEEAEHYFAATRAYVQRKNWDYVIETLKNLLTQLPGKLSEAIELVQQLIEQVPKELRMRWYLVDMMIHDNRLNEARKQMLELLRIDPSQGEGVLMGLDKILEKNPKDAFAHLERGRICFALDREQEARHALEQAHRHRPDDEEIIRNLMGLYQKILDKRDSTEIRFKLGRLAMRMNKYDLAISCFQNTVRDYRWEGESIRNLATCFMHKGMLDLAQQELRRLTIEDDVKELLYELGQRYEAVHDNAGALEVYKLLFASDIDYKDVKGKLETLSRQPAGDSLAAERTAIMTSLSEEASNRYEMIEELGRGAMGIVYKARDNELEEVVALKILPDNLMRNKEALRRFKQEARSARRLSHPNIVRIHDIGEEKGQKFISMEFVTGSDLKIRLRKNDRKPLPMEAVLRYSKEIASAMAYAHSIGIVHRDLKPANLMLTQEDVVKVTDFGIAKIMEQTSSDVEATQAGAIIGTPLYMSPEQVQGREVDHRADIYSMGVVFYELANGRPPFVEGDLSYQHLNAEPKPLQNVPEAYNAVVMKCLAKKREDRWQSMEEIVAVLNRIKV